MKVYRLCRKNEIDRILGSKNFEDVGDAFQNSDKNTHNYIPNEKYMHFFKDKSGLLYLNTLKDRYICVYDIPNEILDKHSGKGKYLNFIAFSFYDEVTEYAIPSKLINFNYLKSIEKIIKDIDYEDFYQDENLNGFVDNIFESDINNKEDNDIITNCELTQ